MYLALDASTKSSGFAIFFDNNTLISYGCLTNRNPDVIKRIQYMVEEIDKILKKYEEITTIVIEEVRPDQGEKNSKTMKALFWLQAAIAFLLHDKYPTVSIEYIYPSDWRATCNIKTGKGILRDKLKQADIDFAKEKYNLPQDFNNDDIADALCIGYSYGIKSKEIINFGI